MTTQQSLSPRQEINRGVIAIYKKHLGRGPTRAQTTLTDDHCLTICDDGLTQVERTLVGEAQAELVRDLRRRFQLAMERDMVGLVEGVTGRKVKCLLSDHDPYTDTAVELLVYERGGAAGDASDG
jgi:uncharacterized protein YbcI